MFRPDGDDVAVVEPEPVRPDFGNFATDKLSGGGEAEEERCLTVLLLVL